MLSSIKNALVIAAHPDDEVLGVGGTIPLLVDAGKKVTVAIVTDGSSAQHGDDLAARERRNTQLATALEILGVDTLVHGTFPDMRLDTVPHIEINKWISDTITKSDCDTVFCHHHGDVNMDHIRIFESTMVATRPTPGQSVERVLSYYVSSSTEWGEVTQDRLFQPNIFVDISSTIDRKLEALEAYSDEIREMPHPRNSAAQRIAAQFAGMRVGLEYAEGFHLIRGLVRTFT